MPRYSQPTDLKMPKNLTELTRLLCEVRATAYDDVVRTLTGPRYGFAPLEFIASTALNYNQWASDLREGNQNAYGFEREANALND